MDTHARHAVIPPTAAAIKSLVLGTVEGRRVKLLHLATVFVACCFKFKHRILPTPTKLSAMSGGRHVETSRTSPRRPQRRESARICTDEWLTAGQVDVTSGGPHTALRTTCSPARTLLRYLESHWPDLARLLHELHRPPPGSRSVTRPLAINHMSANHL